MISVIIPTFNAGDGLAASLSALVPAASAGLIREVVVSDGGSQDHTLEIAEGMGCKIVQAERGRGSQLMAGAAAARGPWLLFLHADTVLSPGWDSEASNFMERADLNDKDIAGFFCFALDSYAWQARILEAVVWWRCLLFALPYGDQGLLLRQSHYRRLGGYHALPLMEDVDLVRRIGRRALMGLRSKAITSAQRYERDGYVKRSLRNLSCLLLYALGRPIASIVQRYEARG